jgi:uncharacterized MAPEG superfamily protein
MALSLWCVLFFVVWTLGLVAFGLGVMRLGAVARGEIRASQIRAGAPQLSERHQRVHRAHANATENLPIFAAVVLVAAVLRYRSNVFESLAVVVVLARVVQSLAHIASGRGHAVTVRFSAFAVQVLSMVAMAILVALDALTR